MKRNLKTGTHLAKILTISLHYLVRSKKQRKVISTVLSFEDMEDSKHPLQCSHQAGRPNIPDMVLSTTMQSLPLPTPCGPYFPYKKCSFHAS